MTGRIRRSHKLRSRASGPGAEQSCRSYGPARLAKHRSGARCRSSTPNGKASGRMSSTGNTAWVGRDRVARWIHRDQRARRGAGAANQRPRHPADVRGIGKRPVQLFLKPVSANLVGTFAEADLSLSKIAAENLPALPIADFGALRQGQLVFAFGSPSGLQNSVSMGVVSSVARQRIPDSPMLDIETDTGLTLATAAARSSARRARW